MIPAGKADVARPPVEERHLSAFGPHRPAQFLGTRVVDPGRSQHDPVVVPRRPGRHLFLEDIARHSIGVALERVPPPAAPGRLDPDDLARLHRDVVGQTREDTLVGAARVDRHLERRAGLAALEAPALEDRTVRDRQERRVLEYTDPLVVTEPAPVLPGSTGVGSEAKAFDPDRERVLDELDRHVLGIGNDMDRVGTVGVVATPRSPTEDLAVEVPLTIRPGAGDAGVTDRLLVGGHATAGRFRQHTGEDPEEPEDHERPRVGGGREDRGQQGARRRELHVDQLDDPLVDV